MHTADAEFLMEKGKFLLGPGDFGFQSHTGVGLLAAQPRV